MSQKNIFVSGEFSPHLNELSLKNSVINLSDKTFILIIPKGIEASDINWELYKIYSEKVNLIFALEDLNLYKACQDNNIKFYWNYPIFTWFELDGILKLNPCYLFINGALTFNLQKLK